MPTQLVRPTLALLGEYVEALRRGWSPDNIRQRAAAEEELARIAADPQAFLAAFDDEQALAGPVPMPDGTTRPRLPSIRRWIVDDGLCGTIGLRWTPDGSPLPPHVLGHVGYAVVPWRRGEGQATRALRLMLGEARARGLRAVELTCDPDNLASKQVIAACGGVFVEAFTRPPVHGGTPALRYRIAVLPAEALQP